MADPLGELGQGGDVGTHMSEQPRKRPWLQFHLSTAVVLMFVAGGILWLNMVPTGHWDGHKANGERTAGRMYGIPMVIVWAGNSFSVDVQGRGLVETLQPVRHWEILGLLCNTIVGLVILFAVACALEWRIRRKERRQ
ncbi:MAG: hypothetical protein NTW87_17690 [Planctomycetota bacterium]|nr:hypothetical protein [Planctomycetota bacterium]